MILNSKYKSKVELQFIAKDGFYIKRLENIDLGKFVNKPYANTSHELIFVTKGSLTHLIDGVENITNKGTISVLEKGHIHEFTKSDNTQGYLVRYENEFIPTVGASYKTTFYGHFKGYLRDDSPHQVLSLEEMKNCIMLLDQLEAEFTGPWDFTVNKGIMQHLLIAVILILERRARITKTTRVANTNGNDKEIYHAFIDLLEEHFLAEHSMTYYSNELGISRRKLSEIVKKFHNKTTKRLHVERIMLEAKRLLAYSNLSLKQIAYQLGFEHAPYFSNRFKEELGLTPNQYRRDSSF